MFMGMRVRHAVIVGVFVCVFCAGSRWMFMRMIMLFVFVGLLRYCMLCHEASPPSDSR